jgi:hypothetical protein
MLGYASIAISKKNETERGATEDRKEDTDNGTTPSIKKKGRWELCKFFMMCLFG